MKKKIKIVSVIFMILAVISLIPYSIFVFMPEYDLSVIWGVIALIFLISGSICTLIHSIMALSEKKK